MKDVIISLNKAVLPELSEPGIAYILCCSDSNMSVPESDHILLLHFQDIIDDKRVEAFASEQAEQIVHFWKQICDNEQIECVFVCYDAGMSRSPAIAAALMRELGQNDDCIWSDAEYDLNPLVYRRLCHAFGHPVTSSELRKKLRLNRIAWHKKFFYDLCEGLKEIIAYERGGIALRVVTFDEDGTIRSEYRKIDETANRDISD